MKQSGIVFFFIAVFLILLGIWYPFPKDGIQVAGATLRFPSYEEYVERMASEEKALDVDSVLTALQAKKEIFDKFGDTLATFTDYLTTDPARIYLPGEDPTYFDAFFKAMERARGEGSVVRILHYGDSQIEIDRISSGLRQNLQERFGGMGPGMVPMIQRIPTISVSQRAEGGLTRYARVGDSTTRRDPYRRYGIMTQFSRTSGYSKFTFRQTKYSLPLAASVSKISVLAAPKKKEFSASIGGNAPDKVLSLGDAADSLVLMSWNLGDSLHAGSVEFRGSADIYGLMLDGDEGVAVDNVSLRGCGGQIFSGMDSLLMARSFALTDHRLIILQFGGNAMPGLSSRKGISTYVGKMKEQFDYFKNVAPNAKLLFVGPSDMGKSVNGHMTTWPLLPDLVDSLRNACLANDVAFWDIFGVMGGKESMVRWVKHNPPLAGPDYIHFTHRGAKEIGEALSTSLLTMYDFYRFRQDHPGISVMEYIDSPDDAERPEKI